jgi:glycosyltransferase involved in cell wall biosynthesis
MRILYANVIEQHAGWGAEFFMDRAFRDLGHETYCVDFRKNRHNLTPFFTKAPPCDVFFLQRGDGFPLPLLEAATMPRVFWASELVSRCRDQDRLLSSGLFDHIFFRTENCIEEVVSRGWLVKSEASILLSSFDPAIHRVLPDVRKDIDVLFCGTLTPRRKRLLEQIGRRCRVHVDNAFGEAFVRLLNRAKIVLNIHGEDFLDTETRVFEALGSGAFLLSERLSSENPFSSTDLVQFDNVNDAVEKIHYYLRNDDEREEIARAGYAAALAGHTYKHRARQILDVFSGLAPGSRTSENFRSTRLQLYGTIEHVRRKLGSFSKVILRT